MDEAERKVHDIGGLPAGAIERDEHAQTLFEKRVDALVMLMVNPRIGVFTLDGLRRAIEQSSPEDYERLGYYEKWLRATRDLLVEQEVLQAGEIARKVEEIRARMERGSDA